MEVDVSNGEAERLGRGRGDTGSGRIVTIVVSSFGTIWTTKWLPNAFTLIITIRRSVTCGHPQFLILMAGAMPFTLFLAISLGQMNRDVPDAVV